MSRVYPACAGIHHGKDARGGRGASLPRMRGDPPLATTWPGKLRRSTPHARGSTL